MATLKPMSYRTSEPRNGFGTVCVTMTQLWIGSGSLNKMPVGEQLARYERYVRNKSDKGDGAAKRVVSAPPRAWHLLQFSALPTLGSIEALSLAGKGNARIDVYVMYFVS